MLQEQNNAEEIVISVTVINMAACRNVIVFFNAILMSKHIKCFCYVHLILSCWFRLCCQVTEQLLLISQCW